jgi:hypothetical protein
MKRRAVDELYPRLSTQRQRPAERAPRKLQVRIRFEVAPASSRVVARLHQPSRRGRRRAFQPLVGSNFAATFQLPLTVTVPEPGGTARRAAVQSHFNLVKTEWFLLRVIRVRFREGKRGTLGWFQAPATIRTSSQLISSAKAFGSSVRDVSEADLVQTPR